MAGDALMNHVAAADPHPQYLLEAVIEQLGDLIVGEGVAAAKRLGIGNPTEILIVSIDTPNQPQWAYVGLVAIPRTAMANKGDILVGTGNGQYSVLPVGIDDDILIADSTTLTGLRWGVATVTCPYALDFSFECDSGYLGAL